MEQVLVRPDTDEGGAMPGSTSRRSATSISSGNGIEILLTGTNVTNTLGITEGNTRQLGSGVASGGVFLGRPLFAPDYQLSLTMQF